MLSLLAMLSLGASAEAAVSEAWSFGEPELAAALDAALAHNPDLEGARARARQAEAQAATGLASRLPGASFDLSASLSPTDSLGFQFGGLPAGGDGPERYGSGSAMVTVSYEVDLWGRHWLSHRASRHEAQAAAGDRDARALGLATLVTATWLDAVAADTRVSIVEDQLQLNRDLLEVVELRRGSGDATALDVLQQRQQLATTQALLPRAQVIHQTTLLSLAALLGSEPGTELALAATLPEPGARPAEPDADTLRERRPDLRSASSRARGAADVRRSTLRAALPAVRVQGQAGWLGFYMDELDTQSTWGAGASLSLPLFNGGAALNAYRGSLAQEDAAEAALASALLAATRDVRSATAREEAAEAELEAVLAQEEAARMAFEEARERYLRGVGAYLSVTTALSGWQRAQLDALEARRGLLDARIQLNDALAVPVEG